VHDLVHVLFLRIDIPVEMDDADFALDTLGYAAHTRIPDRVIASHDHGQGALGKYVRDAFADLVVALGDVGWAENVAHLAHP
jgi:hypothetical protein